MKAGLIFVKRIKRIFKHITPVLLAAAIVFGVVALDYETARATGIEEFLYYTYWDLINTIFVSQGYEVSYNIDTQAPSDSRVTGKQVWEHLCYDVKQFVDFHLWLVETSAETIYDELCSLANTAGTDGLTMSQELWDALNLYAEYCVAHGSAAELTFKQYPSVTNYLNMMGLDWQTNYPDLESKTYNTANFGERSQLGILAGVGTYCDGSKQYFCVSFHGIDDNYQGDNPAKQIVSVQPKFYDDYPYNYKHSCSCGADLTTRDAFSFVFSIADGSTRWTNQMTRNYVYTIGVVNNGIDSNVVNYLSSSYAVNFNPSFSDGTRHLVDVDYTFFTPTTTTEPVADSVVNITGSDSACPAEVPEVVPWEVHPAIPDGWRVLQPDDDPEQDPEEDPDTLPAVIPFRPNVRPAPDDTEDPGTNKPVKPNPGIQINPETGNVIDPTTGYDIDPDTGYLIQPGTGLLINPVTGEVIDPATGEVTGVDPVVAGKYGNITKLFPFCIPFDIINMVKGMQAEKAPPVFHFEYHFDTINYTFEVDVDLSDYDQYIQLFRSGMKIFWIIALMFLTVKVSALFI